MRAPLLPFFVAYERVRRDVLVLFMKDVKELVEILALHEIVVEVVIVAREGVERLDLRVVVDVA